MIRETVSGPRLAAVSAAVGIVFLALYALTSATAVQGLDCGEFATVAATGGVAHPPGYPLFMLLCRIVYVVVPFSTGAYRAALASALMAAGTLFFLSLAAGVITGRLFCALFAPVLLGTSALFWRYATVCDVFTANSFAACASIAAASFIIVKKKYTALAFLFLGFSLALGIGNHHTIVFVLPVHLFALYRLLLSEKTASRKVALAFVFLGSSLLGLLSYVLLLLPGGVWRWGNLGSIASLVHHVLRADYGTFFLQPGSHAFFPAQNLAAFMAGINTQMSLAIVLPCCAGLVLPGIRKSPAAPVVAVLAGCFVLSGPVFLSICNVEPAGIGAFVLERFYILPLSILAMLAALGAQAIVDLLRSRIFRSLVSAMIISTPVACFAAQGGGRHSTYLEDYVMRCLSHVKQQSIIVGSSDSELGGFLYVQSVLGKRRDVVFVAPPLLGFQWYRDMILRQDPGFALPSGCPNVSDPRRFILEICRRNPDRPLYLSPWYESDSSLIRSLGCVVPSGGVLLEIAGHGPCDIDAAEKQLEADLRTLAVRSFPRSAREATSDLEYDVFLNYSRTSHFMARLLGKTGNIDKRDQWLMYATVQARPWLKSGSLLPRVR